MKAKDYAPLYDWAVQNGYDARTARAMLERMMQAELAAALSKRQWLEDQSVALEELLDAIEESTGEPNAKSDPERKLIMDYIKGTR